MSEGSSEISRSAEIESGRSEEESYCDVSESESANTIECWQQQQKNLKKESTDDGGGGDSIALPQNGPGNLGDLTVVQNRVMRMVERVNLISQCLKKLHRELKEHGSIYREESLRSFSDECTQESPKLEQAVEHIGDDDAAVEDCKAVQ